MLRRNREIPEEDLAIINKAFAKTGPVDTIHKNGAGRAIKARKEPGNTSTIVFKSFTGRILKHQMSVVAGKTGGQMVVGVKGQKWDDIPLEKRNLVQWRDTDFI